MTIGWPRWSIPAALPILVVGLVGCGGASNEGAREELPVACIVKPDPGPCHSNQRRFYYDYRDDRCKAFSYGGCEGRVPFPTLQSCVDFCGVPP